MGGISCDWYYITAAYTKVESLSSCKLLSYEGLKKQEVVGEVAIGRRSFHSSFRAAQDDLFLSIDVPTTMIIPTEKLWTL